MPREANDPVITRTTGEGFALMYIGFNSDVMSSSQISDYLNRVVQPRLQSISGVANAEILGGQTFAMRIWLDPDRMAAFGVTPLDVSTALQANNFTTAAGEVKGDYVQTNINAKTSLSDVEGFENLVVATREGHADPAGADRPNRARSGEFQFLFGVRRAEGGVYRGLCDTLGQSADGDFRCARRDTQPFRPNANRLKGGNRL